MRSRTIRHTVKEFLAAKQDKSPRTLEQYEEALAQLKAVTAELPTRPAPIRAALNRAKTPWVRLAWWRVYGSFFHWCVREYELKKNPMTLVERPKVPHKQIHSLVPEQLARVVAAAEDNRCKAIVYLALSSGIRASEFGRIHAADIGPDTMRVLGKGNKEALVPLDPEVRYLLLLLANGRGPKTLLFTDDKRQPISRFAIYRIVRQCMEKAGISGPKMGPHCLRHSLGKTFISDGGDVFTLKKIMRHEHLETTMKYVEIDEREMVKKHSLHSPLRAALQAAQGVLFNQDVLGQAEEILDQA